MRTGIESDLISTSSNYDVSDTHKCNFQREMKLVQSWIKIAYLNILIKCLVISI